jgi:predicted MFS family arabinose efflux permease
MTGIEGVRFADEDPEYATGVTAIALAGVALVIPSRPDLSQARLDVTGAGLLTAGLVALLVAVAQGSTWGWTSSATLGLLAGAIAVLSLWALQQTHTSRPLVEIRLLRHPAVLAGNGCAAVMGIAMYMDLSAVSEFVQMPRSEGFGFSASTAVAGLILLPLAAFMLAGSRMLPMLLRYLGSRLLLASGSLVVSVSSVFFALFHDSLWQAFVMMGILGIGLGTTFAVIPGLIVQAVPPAETGSALGFYQVVRYVGFSLGSALAASILAGIGTHHGQPGQAGYTAVFWVAATVCVAAAGIAWVLTDGVPATAGKASEVPPNEGPRSGTAPADGSARGTGVARSDAA